MTGLAFVAACLLVVPLVVVRDRKDAGATSRLADTLRATFGLAPDHDDPRCLRGAIDDHDVTITLVSPPPSGHEGQVDRIPATVSIPVRGMPRDLVVEQRNVSLRTAPVGSLDFERCRIVDGSRPSQRWLTAPRRAALLRRVPSLRTRRPERAVEVVEIADGAIHRTLPAEPAKAIAAIHEHLALADQLAEDVPAPATRVGTAT